MTISTKTIETQMDFDLAVFEFERAYSLTPAQRAREAASSLRRKLLAKEQPPMREVDILREVQIENHLDLIDSLFA